MNDLRIRDVMTPSMSPVDCLTMDGRIVQVRPVLPEDAEALLALHGRLSPHSRRYLRFFSACAAPGAEVRRLVRPPGADRLSLLVEEGGTVLAVGSYERIDDTRADFALVVDDEHHGEGLGTLLLEHLAAAARREGIAELIGDVLPDNAAMLQVSSDLAPVLPTSSATTPVRSGCASRRCRTRPRSPRSAPATVPQPTTRCGPSWHPRPSPSSAPDRGRTGSAIRSWRRYGPVDTPAACTRSTRTPERSAASPPSPP